MPYLARKIDRGKWSDLEKIAGVDDIPSDPITANLRTSDNTLSLWRVDTKDKTELDKIFLALATGPRFDKIDAISIVLVDETTLLGKVDIIESEGDTAVAELKHLHRDITNVNYKKLGIIANEIVESLLSDDTNFCLYSKNEVKTLLKTAYLSGNIEKKRLSKKLQEELSKLDVIKQ